MFRSEIVAIMFGLGVVLRSLFLYVGELKNEIKTRSGDYRLNFVFHQRIFRRTSSSLFLRELQQEFCSLRRTILNKILRREQLWAL